MSYNPNYVDSEIQSLEDWLKNNRNSIKSYCSHKGLNYTNFRRFLARKGFARFKAHRSGEPRKIIFITVTDKQWGKLKSKADKSKKKLSAYARDILLS